MCIYKKHRTQILLSTFIYCRNYMFTKRHFKPWSILFPQQLHIISFFGRPDHQLIATSAKAFCGGWRDKDFVAPNAVLSAMKNARTCSMLIAYNVSIILRKVDAWFSRHSLSTQFRSTLYKATYIIWVTEQQLICTTERKNIRTSCLSLDKLNKKLKPRSIRQPLFFVVWEKWHYAAQVR